MSDFCEKTIETFAPEETFALGKQMGEQAEPGAVIALDGELGVGKTVFAQGVAAGLGITDAVNSPTFTILQIYEGGRMPLYHFDVYRIGSPEEMEETGYADCLYGTGVSLIEWSSLVPGILPDRYCGVRIEKDPEKGFDYRRITVTEHGS